MRSDPNLAFSPDFEATGTGLPGRRFQDGASQSGGERNHLFLNEGGAAFHDVSGLSGLDSNADGRAFAWLDYDRDGWLDFAVVNANTPFVELFRNEMGEGADDGFVVFELVGANEAARASETASSRSAVGSRVEIDVGDRTLVRELRAGEGLAAQNAARLHFGVGDATKLTEIRIRWPSGRTTTLRDLPVGRRIVVRESPRDGEAPYAVYDDPPVPTASRIRAALRRAAAYIRTFGETDPSWRGVLGYLHRRFGVRFALADGRAADDPGTESGEPQSRAILARMEDRDAPTDAAAIAGLASQTDRMTAVALHCDRLPLPANWLEVLRAAGRACGYALTHAALASQWSVENGCIDVAAAAPVQAELADALVALVEDRGRLAETLPASADVWMEAVALLTYLGLPDSVSPEWIASILADQRADGGWAPASGKTTSDPHATVMAIWSLVEALHPNAEPSRWLPPRHDGENALSNAAPVL